MSGLLFAAQLALSGLSLQVHSGEDVVQAMFERYQGQWYETLTFVQHSTFYDEAGEVDRVETWFESAHLPHNLRIDIEGQGRTILFMGDTTYAFQDGAPTGKRARLNALLVLGFSVYQQPAAETVRQLGVLGFDLRKVREDVWQDRPVYIVGADEGDTSTRQFWVDKERLLFVRELQGQSEIQFNKYQRLGGGWIAPEVDFYTDGRRTLIEEYTEMEADPELDPEIFSTEGSAMPAWIEQRGGGS